jgi:multidrug efflux pump subunit AcrA (membrane-fusion protein)
MEHSLRAPYDGIVQSVAASSGDQVEAGQVLVVVDQTERQTPDRERTKSEEGKRKTES